MPTRAKGKSNMGKRRTAASKAPSGSYLARREALLRAAGQVFKEKGFQAVRMDDVAEQLKIDRATLYYYFGNKQQLFRAVITDAVQENVDTVVAIAESDASPRDKVRAVLVSLFESYDRHYPLLYVYVQEDMRRLTNADSRRLSPLMELGLRYDDAVKRIVEEGIEAGDFNPNLRPTLCAYAIIGAANWSHRWYSPAGELSGTELGEHFAELMLDGLLVGAARRRGKPRAAKR
jgi:AcrR family transcriptional regulator